MDEREELRNQPVGAVSMGGAEEFRTQTTVTGASDRAEDLKGQPIGELFKQLSQDTATLVRQEIQLAKVEMTEKGKHAGRGAGLVGAGGVIGFLALFSFTLFLIFMLAEAFNNVWLAALLVALVYGAVAAFLAMKGRDKLKEAAPATPEQTVETVKEDIEWAKHPTTSAKR
jgi:uncharacterized membrane protein YqjE